MTRVTVDSATIARLQSANEFVEICNESGTVVGHFYPVTEPPRDADGKLICPYSEHEIEALSQQSGGRSLQEILRDLTQR